MVGTTAAFSFRLTVPGGETPAAGVTMVGVLPSHRRRGILTALMRLQLDDVRARGEPLAFLSTSEGGIYGRFGFGVATRNGRISIERDRAALGVAPPVDASARLVSHEDALELIAPIYERARAARPGLYARSRAWWEARTLADPPDEQEGGGPLVRAVVEVGGRPEGYALYRVHPATVDNAPAGELRIREVLSTSVPATQALWRLLFGVDLVSRVSAWSLPADDPVFLLVLEPARLRFTLADGHWLRLVDVPAALASRSYACDGSLALELSDPFCPWNEGRWRLESGSPARVTRTDRPAELRLGTADLAAAYLGGFRFAELARAGRVEELASGALARADALFATDRAPWCPEIF